MNKERPHMKKCPKCGSGRILIRGTTLICQRPGCNYENDMSATKEIKTLNWRKGNDK